MVSPLNSVLFPYILVNDQGGENIFPADIERALETHPGIAAAACIGIPDEHWGEVVGVFLQRAGGLQSETPIDSKGVKAWLRKKVAPHKMPEHFFWLGDGGNVPDQLPFNHTGKLMKAELRVIATRIVKGRRSCNI